MDRLFTLVEAAAATGQSATRLRSWCATGKLGCEKQDGQWVIPLRELLRVSMLVEDHNRAVAAGKAAALVVPVSAATPDLPAEIARRLGLAERTVTTSTLALDGTEYMLAVWKSEGTGGAASLAPVAELVHELGGELLDGEAAGD